MSFIFGGNTGLTYDDIQRKRAVADQLLAGLGTPRNVGEGLSAIGKALAIRGMNKQASKADAANRDAFNSKWAGLFGGGAPGVTPASAPVSAPAPNSPQGIASDTMAALGKDPVFTPGDRESFVAAMMPHAMRVSEATGLDPRLVIAQAAQETGWGKSAPNNNFFGIKSHGEAGGANLGTFEYVNGQPVNVNDSFRTYGGMGESADGYAKFLMENPRYKAMLSAGDLDGQLAALGQSGYATDPNYASSVGAIAKGIQLPGQPQQGGQPGGMNMATLAEIAGDPYASPGQKAIVNALLQQQLNAGDPAYRLDLELKKAQLEAARGGGDKPELVRQREELARISGLEPGTPEWQQFMLTGNTIGRGANEYGLQPIIGQDENGNVVIMQLGKDGTAIQTQLPEGVSPNLGLRREEEARGAAAGKAAGEAMIDLPGARITADRTLALVDELYNDPYLDRMVGPFDSALPNVSASAARVQGRMDQLQGTAFLEAYNMLRGGGQITEVEGKKAEAAMARLKTAQNEDDYRAALMDFRDAVETGIRKLEARAGGTAFRPEGTDDLSDDEKKFLGLQ